VLTSLLGKGAEGRKLISHLDVAEKNSLRDLGGMVGREALEPSIRKKKSFS